MILICPSCNTRYLVPDAAIGPTGRQVRCAACKHSWFQDPPVLDLEERREASEPDPATEPEPDVTPIPPSVEPRPVYGDDDVPVARPPAAFDPYAHEAPFRPRRNPARMWTLLAVIAAVVMLGAVAALAYFGPPDIAQRLGFAPRPSMPLIIERTRAPERRHLPSGNELFSVTGRIVNPTDKTQTVPDVHANLLDAQGRIVYAWTIARPVSTLPPGGAVTINGATLDVPGNAKTLVLSLDARQAAN